jgi:hypothetical protein
VLCMFVDLSPFHFFFYCTNLLWYTQANASFADS